MRSGCSTPRTVVAGGHSATSAQAPCRSTRRSNASATIHISWNCARHSGEPPQLIDAKSEGLPWKLQVEVEGLGILVRREVKQHHDEQHLRARQLAGALAFRRRWDQLVGFPVGERLAEVIET